LCKKLSKLWSKMRDVAEHLYASGRRAAARR
jgi:hypothetical protein